MKKAEIKMQILNRAKHLYSNKYFISDSIDFRFNQMYLKVEGVWIECEQSTRSINLPDMIDSEGTKIFASLSDCGKGGSSVSFYGKEIGYIFFKDGKYQINDLEDGDISNLETYSIELKVTGIQE